MTNTNCETCQTPFAPWREDAQVHLCQECYEAHCREDARRPARTPSDATGGPGAA